MELPREVPVMTLPEAILFPQALLPLYIFEPRYRRMLSDALNTSRMFSVAMQRPGRTRESPSGVAGLGLIRASVARKDGTSNLILQGIARVELAETVSYRPYRIHRIRPLPSITTDSVAVDALTAKVLELVAERFEQGLDLPFHLLQKLGNFNEGKPATPEFTVARAMEYLAGLDDPAQIADHVSSTLLGSPLERQLLLETIDVETRLKHLVHFLMAEIRRHQKD